MKVVCAWCGAEMGCKGAPGSGAVSHGICAACCAKMLAEPETKTDEKLTTQISH